MKEINKYFIYVGNAYPHKNLERAVKAMVLLNRELETKVLFFIVSSRNVFTQRLEKIISKAHAGEFVKLLGFVEDEKLRDLYKNSVGFLYPSLVEGFGLPGLEAMKSGALVLCSDIPVFKEIYQKYGIYFDPKDSNSIKEAMQEVLRLGKVERERVIEDGKKFVERYSWEKMAKETLNVYKEVLYSL